MAVRTDVDTLIEEVRNVALEAAMLGSDWPGVRKTALDVIDTASALRASDQEAAAHLVVIARILSAQSWKMAERRVGYKGGGALKTKLGNLRQVRTAHLAGLRGRG